MIRLIVTTIYSIGFWTVTSIVAWKSDTFSLEPFLFIYTTGLGMIFTVVKDKKEPTPDPREEQS